MNTTRRLWLFQQAVTATIFFLLFSLYIFLVFSRENPTTNLPDFPGKSAFPVKVYLYNLPRRFTYGVTEHYWSLRGCHVSSPVADVSDVKFPPALALGGVGPLFGPNPTGERTNRVSRVPGFGSKRGRPFLCPVLLVVELGSGKNPS